MTTSYESNATDIGGQPNYNAEGHQVWNPQVGIYFKPAETEADSFGGVVGALQDVQVLNDVVPKSYPHNFAGIIAAIQDLAFSQKAPPVVPGPDPGNGQIIINDQGQPIWDELAPMPDGSLWFDTRQGRLFVSIEDEWYQTNGADGLAIVTLDAIPPEIEHYVPGQFWWNSLGNDLYIFDGQFELDDGSFTDDPTAGGTPVWKLVFDGDDEGQQTTYTLPLGAVDAAVRDSSGEVLDYNYITSIDPDATIVQADYNVWLHSSLSELDQALFDRTYVTYSDTAPSTVRPGEFWFDTTSSELSIWYDDGSTQLWVPTFKSYDDEIAALEDSIAADQSQSAAVIAAIQANIQTLTSGSVPYVADLNAKVALLEDHVANHPQDVDLTPYATDASVQASISSLSSEIDAVRVSVPDVSGFATQVQVSAVEADVAQLPTSADVANSILAAQPDLTSFVTQNEIDQSIAGITTEYLPRTGGTLSGSFVVQKEIMSNPAFDFSSEPWYSYNTHKYRTNGPGNHYTTFGTNEKAWEYAWDFSSNEDFCWVNGDGNKVFSISKEGPACSTLVLGDFQPNDNANGRVLINQINVRDKLNEHSTTLATHTQQLSDIVNGAYTNDSGVIYSDNAPTGVISDGALWFDSYNIRLNVRHQGAWIYPDRVEDSTLKAELFNAVSDSNDFDTLKIKLLAALS